MFVLIEEIYWLISRVYLKSILLVVIMESSLICGKFKFMPKTEGMKDFPSNLDNLTEVSVSKWRQFIFASIDPEYRFEELIKDLEDRVG